MFELWRLRPFRCDSRRESAFWRLYTPGSRSNGEIASQPVRPLKETRRCAFFSTADNRIHFQYGDHLGTDHVRTDNAGNGQVVFDSLPFGEPNYTSGGSDLNPGHYAGLEQDGSFSATSLGLQHAKFREYNSTLGRWMSTDPLSSTYDDTSPQSMNRYTYARNNPLMYLDPDGTSDDFYNNGDPWSQSSSPGGFAYMSSTHGGSGSLGDYFQADLGRILEGLPPVEFGDTQTPPDVKENLENTVMASLAAAGFLGPANVDQPCLAQKVVNAIPGATLTGKNTYQGGHQEFGISVSGADLIRDYFAPFTSPFGNGNGYRSQFSQVHVNGQSGNISTISNGGQVPVQGHVDFGNASLGFVGEFKHGSVDVVLGTLFGWIPGSENFLDPRC